VATSRNAQYSPIPHFLLKLQQACGLLMSASAPHHTPCEESHSGAQILSQTRSAAQKKTSQTQATPNPTHARDMRRNVCGWSRGANGATLPQLHAHVVLVHHVLERLEVIERQQHFQQRTDTFLYAVSHDRRRAWQHTRKPCGQSQATNRCQVRLSASPHTHLFRAWQLCESILDGLKHSNMRDFTRISSVNNREGTWCSHHLGKCIWRGPKRGECGFEHAFHHGTEVLKHCVVVVIKLLLVDKEHTVGRYEGLEIGLAKAPRGRE